MAENKCEHLLSSPLAPCVTCVTRVFVLCVVKLLMRRGETGQMTKLRVNITLKGALHCTWCWH